MNPIKAFLILIAAALLPNVANASMDSISADSKLSSHCELVTKTVAIPGQHKKFDPMEKEINAMLSSTSDPVLASYYRDLYRASATSRTEWFVRSVDPYADAVNIALHGPIDPKARQAC